MAALGDETLDGAASWQPGIIGAGERVQVGERLGRTRARAALRARDAVGGMKKRASQGGEVQDLLAVAEGVISTAR